MHAKHGSSAGDIAMSQQLSAKSSNPMLLPHENLYTWSALMEVLTMPGSSPAIQQSLQDWEVCRVALSCHFALDILYLSIEW